jgi:uncharacterized membrane protein YhaH (DUF805 family)
MLWTLALKRYFQFSGRSTRAEYRQFAGFYIVAVIVVAVLESSTSAYQQTGTPTLTFLVFFGLLVPMYAVTFRRLHDRNLSGWFIGALLGLNAVWFMIDHLRSFVRGLIVDVPFMLFNGVDVVATILLSLYLLYQTCLRGDDGPDRFGAPPSELPGIAHPQGDAARSLARAAAAFFPESRRADPISQLERLAKLHRDGALTDAEFEQQKAVLLQHAGE